jgi:hypothetical protein
MAWTVAFALLGALLFSIVIAPVLASFAFAKGAKEWHNPLMSFLIERYRVAVRWAIRRRAITIGVCALLVAVGSYLAFSGTIGSEFLPHLDEGALWVRGILRRPQTKRRLATCLSREQRRIDRRYGSRVGQNPWRGLGLFPAHRRQYGRGCKWSEGRAGHEDLRRRFEGSRGNKRCGRQDHVRDQGC